MAKNKTTYTLADVSEFINTFANTEQKKKDSFKLIKILKKITNEEPKMWGTSIIGFGNYHYKYQSGHEGNAPMLAFSPRKPAFSLYIYSDTEKSKALLPQFGRFKITKGCIYVKTLADIDIEILKELCRESIQYLNEHHECSCHNK